MTTLEITSKSRLWLLVGIAVGAICLGMTWFADIDQYHSRFWSNLLHNSVFFTGIGIMGGFFLSASIIAWAGWYTVFKRVWESISMFMIVGLVLMGFFAVATMLDWHHLYHWTQEGITELGHENYDEIIAGKAGFLNKTWYLGGTLILIGIWLFLAKRIRSLSLAEDNDKSGADDFTYAYSMRKYAAAYLPLAGFGTAAMIWLWIMSLDAHWYSTMFAWYTGASWFVSMMCLTVLILQNLKGKGYFPTVTTEHFHDLGKLIFAFSIFWTYLWFSQFMLIWYANVGEETGYFKLRMDEYPILFWGNLAINFVLPFFVLMRNDTKRKMGSLSFIALMVLFGHWLDFFLMIKPGVLHTSHILTGHGGHGDHSAHGEAAAHGAGHGHEAGGHGVEQVTEFLAGFHLPGFLEIGTFIGFLCLFLFFVYNSLSSAPLHPENDVYLEESLHHHT